MAEINRMAGCFIGVDMGTSAMKGVLVSESGDLLASVTQAMEIERPKPDEVVFSSDRHYEILCKVLRALTDKAGGATVGAVALSGATGDTVLLGNHGSPLLPAIHWMDSRSAKDNAVDPPGLSASDIHRISGWPWFRGFPMAHLAWLKQNRPDAYHKAARVGMNITYQLFRLSGAWAMDYSTATTFYLQEQQKRTWYRPYLEWLGLKEAQLPALMPSGSRIGAVTAQTAAETGLPQGCAVVLGAFDHPSAARGAGIRAPGDLLLSLGTSWVGFLPVMAREMALQQNMLVDPFFSDAAGPWGAMFSLSKAGEQLNAVIQSAYWHVATDAERYGLLEEDLRIFISSRMANNEAVKLTNELVLAMLEKTEALSRKGMPVERIVLVGGPSGNAALVDLFALVFNKPVNVAASAGYAGAFGAALMAMSNRGNA